MAFFFFPDDNTELKRILTVTKRPESERSSIFLSLNWRELLETPSPATLIPCENGSMPFPGWRVGPHSPWWQPHWSSLCHWGWRSSAAGPPPGNWAGQRRSKCLIRFQGALLTQMTTAGNVPGLHFQQLLLFYSSPPGTFQTLWLSLESMPISLFSTLSVYLWRCCYSKTKD